MIISIFCDNSVSKNTEELKIRVILKYENRTSPFTWFMKLKKKTFVEFMIYIKDFK